MNINSYDVLSGNNLIIVIVIVFVIVTVIQFAYLGLKSKIFKDYNTLGIDLLMRNPKLIDVDSYNGKPKMVIRILIVIELAIVLILTMRPLGLKELKVLYDIPEKVTGFILIAIVDAFFLGYIYIKDYLITKNKIK